MNHASKRYILEDKITPLNGGKFKVVVSQYVAIAIVELTPVDHIKCNCQIFDVMSYCCHIEAVEDYLDGEWEEFASFLFDGSHDD